MLTNSEDPDEMQHNPLKVVLILPNSEDPDEMQHNPLKVVLILPNSEDPDEMQHNAAFHQGSTLFGKIKTTFRDRKNIIIKKKQHVTP